ncbi:MAG: hypothetical protein FJ147_19155 [Deltaproteobacteria bacterium]|nr:hypothetical protein [Deltaproteobacteria bacterium]
MGNSTLDEIVAELMLTSDKVSPILHDQVKVWMKTDDIEALGALYELLTEKRFYTRIQPPLQFDDYHSFILQYYERCLREDPDGKWSNSRYSAGGDLVGWFIGLWRDSSVPRSALLELKEWLAKLYKQGDEKLRVCLITATLEHLFQDRKIAKYFADWRKDTILADAYDEALGYANHLRKQ